jgi:hypothetical protein
MVQGGRKLLQVADQELAPVNGQRIVQQGVLATFSMGSEEYEGAQRRSEQDSSCRSEKMS